MSATARIDDLLDLDAELTPEDKELRETVRRFGEQRLRPHIAEWFEAGEVPVRELASDLGKLGVLGMHLEGYGCGGSTATAYGLVCMELEAVDSGLRSLVSVQGSLAMFAIHRHGSEEQRKQWLPDMATGDAIGCFGLTEPDFGSNPGGMRTTARRDGSDWILNGSKMWITNGSVADVAVVWARAEEGVLGFLVPAGTKGFEATEMKRKLSLRASVTSELHLADVRLPAEAQLPEARGLSGPLACLSEARFGIVFGSVGAARDCLETTIDYVGTREVFDKPLAGIPAHAGQDRRYGRRTRQGAAAGDASRQAEGRRTHPAGPGQLRQAEQLPGSDQDRAAMPNPVGRQRNHPGIPGAPTRQQPGIGDDLRGHVRGAPDGHRRGADGRQRLPMNSPTTG